MYNKRLFSKTNDKKLLHKVGKQWVTISIAMLMLIGGSAVVSHTTHAATNAPKATSVANQPAQRANTQPKQVSGSTIQSSASNLHQALLNNSVKSNVKPSNNTPIHQTAKPNSAYANYLKQMGGQSAYNNLMNNEAKNSSNKNKYNRPKLTSNNDPYAYYFSGTKTNGSYSDLGLHYVCYSNGGLEFTSGTAQSNLSHLIYDIDQKTPDSYFSGSNSIAIKFDSGVDTSHVTNMSSIFNSDHDLISIDLTNVNTKNVTNMSDMFRNDSSLQSLILPNSFNTSNVTDMSGIFNGDSSLQSLTLPNSFNTSNVTDMSNMFNGDKNLQSLTLPNSFNTSNVTDMSGMFTSISLDSSDLTNLLKKLNTNKVTNMNSMFSGIFYNYGNTQSLILPNSFNTSNVTDMSYMFGIAGNLQSLILPNSFNTSNVTDMSNMFSGDSSLQSLTLPNSFNTSNVTDMSDMFSNMYDSFSQNSRLQSLTLSNSFNTSNVTNMHNMFSSTYPSTLIIQSSDTKFNSDVYLPSMYRKLPNTQYTSSIPHNFNNNNVGTFEITKNPEPIAIINYKYKGHTVKEYITPKQKNLETPININEPLNNTSYSVASDKNIMTNGKSVSNVITNGNTYDVPVYINYQKEINSLATKASDEAKIIKSYQDNSASISNADNWVYSNSSSATSADKWTNNNGSTISNEAESASTSANTNAITINTNSTNATNDANIAQGNAENYADNSINANTNAINNNMNSLSGSADSDYNNAVNNENNTAFNLAGNISSLSNSANAGIKANTKAITNLSVSASNALNNASSAISANKTAIDNLSRSTSTGLDNAKKEISNNKNQISSNVTNANNAINNINKMLSESTKANNQKLANDIKAIDNALTTKEDKNDFSKATANIHKLLNIKADNAKIMNDEKQLQNAINSKPNNIGSTTVETTGTNDNEVNANENALQNEINTKANKAEVEAKLQKLQNDLAKYPTSNNKFISKSFYIVVKKPILIHKTAKAIGSNKDVVGTLKPSKYTKIHVLGIKDGHYVIKYMRHYYFITANHKYVQNAYYQKHDLKKNNYIKIIRPAGEYRKSNYTKYNQRGRITTWNAGTVMPIRSLQILGNNDVTRFKLVNGHYITANKLFVKLI